MNTQTGEKAVIIDNVSKKYARSIKRAMVYGLQDIARAALIPGRFRSPNYSARISDSIQDAQTATAEVQQNPVPLRPSEFWALDRVTIEIKRGECLGLIGSNGAGKSTLFSVVSGIFGPTSGRVEVRGRLQALISLGAGFHPMLTGRENIYINAAILGMDTQTVNRKIDHIIEFSDLGDFIDAPVKMYSSGMLVRLGFGVAAHLDPDVMLIDEILAVGDMRFQKKCIDKINAMCATNMAIALVSHSLYRVESLCQHVVWLDHGRIVQSGPAKQVVRAYRDHEITSQGRTQFEERDDHAPIMVSPFFVIHGVDLLHMDGRVDQAFGYREPFKARIRYTALERIERPLFNLAFISAGARVFETSMLIDGHAPEFVMGPGEIEVTIKNPILLPRNYEVHLFIRNREGAIDLIEMQRVAAFSVTSAGLDVIPSNGPYAYGHLMQSGLVHFEYSWELSKCVQSR